MTISEKQIGGVSCIAVMACWLLPSALIAFWTDRNLDFWLTQLKGEEVDVPYWASFLVTFFGNAFILAANTIGEIGRLIL